MASTTKVIDPSSLSNLDQVVTKHVHFNWTISFTEKKIGGNVVLDLVTLVPNVEKVVLDSSYLDLKNVSLNDHSLKVSNSFKPNT
jgi:aminopeptidase N